MLDMLAVAENRTLPAMLDVEKMILPARNAAVFVHEYLPADDVTVPTSTRSATMALASAVATSVSRGLVKAELVAR